MARRCLLCHSFLGRPVARRCFWVAIFIKFVDLSRFGSSLSTMDIEAPCPSMVPLSLRWFPPEGSQVPLRMKFFSRNPIYTSAPPPRFWPEPPWHMLVPYDGPPPHKIPIPFMDPVVREMAIRAAWVMVHCPPEEFEWDELGYHRITQPWQ